MSEKGEMADRARSQRDYEETYGRGGGEEFDRDDYPHGYTASDAGDWRRALRAYVAGHDRGWEADRKHREAERRAPPSRPGGTGAGAGAVEEAPGGADEATAETERGTRFGVGIPDRDRLDFHRGASRWRDRLPRATRLPRHTDRELSGHKGEGDQA